MGRAQLGGAAGRKGHKIMMEQKATADLTWVLSKADLPWFYTGSLGRCAKQDAETRPVLIPNSLTWLSEFHSPLWIT